MACDAYRTMNDRGASCSWYSSQSFRSSSYWVFPVPFITESRPSSVDPGVLADAVTDRPGIAGRLIRLAKLLSSVSCRPAVLGLSGRLDARRRAGDHVMVVNAMKQAGEK